MSIHDEIAARIQTQTASLQSTAATEIVSEREEAVRVARQTLEQAEAALAEAVTYRDSLIPATDENPG